MTRDIFCGRCNTVTPHEFRHQFQGDHRQVVANEQLAFCANLRRRHRPEAIAAQHELEQHEVLGHPIFLDEHYEDEATVCDHCQKFSATSLGELDAAIELHNLHNKVAVTAEELIAMNQQAGSLFSAEDVA